MRGYEMKEKKIFPSHEEAKRKENFLKTDQIITGQICVPAVPQEAFSVFYPHTWVERLFEGSQLPTPQQRQAAIDGWLSAWGRKQLDLVAFLAAP